MKVWHLMVLIFFIVCGFVSQSFEACVPETNNTEIQISDDFFLSQEMFFGDPNFNEIPRLIDGYSIRREKNKVFLSIIEVEETVCERNF